MAQASDTDRPIDVGDGKVILNITNSGAAPPKQRQFVGAFGKGLLINIVASWLSSWAVYLVAAYRVIPFLFMFGLWLCGGTGEMPPLPGTVAPAAVDPRFDSVQPMLDAMQSKIDALETQLKEDRARNADHARRIQEETDRLAATTRQAVESEKAARDSELQSLAETAQAHLELEKARTDFATRSQEIPWLELALVNAEIKQYSQSEGEHINAQCPHCHATLWLRYPQKDDVGHCSACHRQYSVVLAWKLAVPVHWPWKRSTPSNPLLDATNRRRS